MHLKLISLIIILSRSFPCAFSSISIVHDSVCDPDYTFGCGNVRYLLYPFWGGNWPQTCGLPGFELYCVQNIPMLNISSMRYRVQEINFNRNTIRVARDDLLSSNICPGHIIQDPYLSPYISPFPSPQPTFRYLDNSDSNISLYFRCKLLDPTINPLNTFGCKGDKLKTINVFGPKPGNVSCKDSMSVRINKDDAQSLKHPDALSINILRSAINTGIWLQYFYNGQTTLPSCNYVTYGSCLGCEPNGNTCQIFQRACEYANRCSNQGTSSEDPAPTDVQAPSQSPYHPPQSGGSGTGARSPFQNPTHHPESGGDIYSTRDGGGRWWHNKSRKTLGVVLGVTGIVFLTTICAVCFIKRRGFLTSADQDNNYKVVEAFLLQHGPHALKRYKYSEIKKMTKFLSDKLGQGGYGSVYKGNLPDGTFVAVKVLSSTDGNVEDFVNEVASISRTSHVNIVNLLGFCFDRRKRALVYEYMPNKSLDKYINNRVSSLAGTNCCLDMEILYKISVGVAEGLDYLHRCCNTRIVHFDIKPQNILLDEEFCPKISDFGLAKLCKKKQSLLSVPGTRGTVGYIAPEVFSRNFGGVSHKSDVYSYGMMVLEMAGANMISGHTNETTQSIEDYFPDKIYERVLDTTRKLGGSEIEVDEETARKMLLIGFWCIQTNPSDRPSISKVVEMFGGSIESIQTPPKPVLFTPTLPVWGVSSSFSSYVDETQPSAEGVTQTQLKVSVNGSG